MYKAYSDTDISCTNAWSRFAIPLFFHRCIRTVTHNDNIPTKDIDISEDGAEIELERCGVCLYRKAGDNPRVCWFVSRHTKDYTRQTGIDIYSIPPELQKQLLDWRITASEKSGEPIFHGMPLEYSTIFDIRGSMVISFDPDIPPSLGSKIEIPKDHLPKLLIFSTP